jgi:hypothetical protein
MQKYAFQDAKFMTAREKELVLKAWIRFLKHGLRWQDFSHWLYKHLHLHCGFIAHYNRLGFYETYFVSGEETVRFLSQFDKRGECLSVEFGGTMWSSGDCEDLKRAMIEEGQAFIPKLIESAQAKQRDSNVAAAHALLKKHGLFIEGYSPCGTRVRHVPANPTPTLIVIVVIPIAFLMPAALMFFPPLMALTPATLARLAQLTALVVCLSAMASVFCDCLMKFMIRVSDPPLASVEVFRVETRHRGTNQSRCEND